MMDFLLHQTFDWTILMLVVVLFTVAMIINSIILSKTKHSNTVVYLILSIVVWAIIIGWIIIRN